MQYKSLIIGICIGAFALLDSAIAADVTRQDFVESIIEQGCESCKNAHALTQWKYARSSFVDMIPSATSEYICANMAEQKGFIEGYDKNTPCQDGSNPDGMKFCPNNAITKIEAVAIILRSAYLWNEELDQKTTNPRNTPNGLDPKWAHYLEKTREYNIWGSSLEGVSWNTPLTSEEQAQLLSRLSSIQPICPSSANTSLGGLGVQIRASVDEGSLRAEGIVKGPFADKALIEWSLITRDKTGDTTTKIKQNSLTLDPIALKADTEYGLILSVTSTDGIKSTAFINASTTKVPLNPSIDPLWDGIPLLLTAKNTTPLVWQLDRGRATENSTLTQTISNAGVHTLSSSQGGIFSLSSIFVTPDNDLDKDGIINALDKCPRLKSQGGANGCPAIEVFGNRGISIQPQERDDLLIDQGEIIAESVGGDRSGGIGSLGDIFGAKNGAIKGIYQDASACEREAIRTFGSLDIVATCMQCPCDQSLRSRLTIKACDQIYPAYLSSDKSTLYSQGSAGEVPFRFGFEF